MSSIPSEQAALLKAVCDNLDDDTPRLVYADWLQETGIEANIARAEFIRLQIERARTGGLASREESRLLTAYNRPWLSELSAYPGLTFPELSYDRGFLSRMSAKTARAFLEAAPDVFARVPVTELRLETLTAETAAELSRSKHLLRIRHLEQFADGWNDDVLGALAESPFLSNLRQFWLGARDVTITGLQPFLANPALTGLVELQIIRGNQIGPGLVRAILDCPSAPNLELIDLDWCLMGRAAAEDLPGLVRLPNLKRLSLLHNVVGDAGAETLAAVKIAGRQHIVLAGNNLTDRGGEALLNGPLLPSPGVTVDLHRNGLSEDMMIKLEQAFGRRLRLWI